MNRPVAILLLALHVFNLGGYQLVFNKASKEASARFISSLDKREYSDDQLIEVKVPVNLPYQSNWSDFERYNGEIEISGVHYNYVKRKMFNDTLILMCIPNAEQMKIASAKDAFFSLVNNLQHPGHQKAPAAPGKAVKSVTTEYLSDAQALVPVLSAQLPPHARIMHEVLPPATPRSTEAQPPEALS